MDQTWAAIDRYFEEEFVHEPDFIKAAYAAARAAKLPEISVSAAQGKFLALMVAISGARRVLEVGTLGGYSTLWMAQSLPEDGHLTTLEHNPVCAGVARANFAHAGLADKIMLRYGDALDSFKALVGEKPAPFDLIFIDANKADYPTYLEWSLRLSHPGTVILADNVIRSEALLDAASEDKSLQGLRAFHAMVGAHKKLEATALQSVGIKGYDGFSLLRVIA
jgi:predicted O-methyltransferase YrrM